MNEMAIAKQTIHWHNEGRALIVKSLPPLSHPIDYRSPNDLSSEVVIVKGRCKMNTSSAHRVTRFWSCTPGSKSLVMTRSVVTAVSKLSILYEILNKSNLVAAELAYFMFQNYHIFTKIIFVFVNIAVS